MSFRTYLYIILELNYSSRMLLLNKKEVVVIVSPFTSHICKINTLSRRVECPQKNGSDVSAKQTVDYMVGKVLSSIVLCRNDDSVKFQAYVCVDWKWKCTDV